VIRETSSDEERIMELLSRSDTAQRLQKVEVEKVGFEEITSVIFEIRVGFHHVDRSWKLVDVKLEGSCFDNSLTAVDAPVF